MRLRLGDVIRLIKQKLTSDDHDWHLLSAFFLSSYMLFLWRIDIPSSSNSAFDTHIFLKVGSDARMLPPIQVEYFLKK